MNTHQSLTPQALQFDFRMKFYVSRSTNYRDLWNSPLWDMVTGSLDFTDWTDCGIISESSLNFADVTSKFVALKINYTTANSFALWSVALTGHTFDSALLYRGRLMVCLLQMDYRTAGGVWTTTPWGIGFVGAIKAVAPTLSPRINGEFSLTVEGLGHYLSTDFMPARSWGKFNIAKGKTCSWSSTLGDPTILYNKGEFVGTQVTLGPENAVDGSTFGPPAASAIPPSGIELVRTIPTHAFIREVFAWPPSGYGLEYQWISVSADTKQIMTKGQGTYEAHEGDDIPNHTTYWGFETPYPASDGGNRYDVGVFCYSRKRVEELFDLGDVSWVVEWGRKNNHYLSQTEDYVSIGDGTVHHPHKDGVFWSQNSAYVPAIPVNLNGHDAEMMPSFEWESGHAWYGLPGFNRTNIPDGSGLARRIWHSDTSSWELEKDTDAPGDWLITANPTPACWVDTSQWEKGEKAPGPADYPSYQFGIVELGEMSCLLSQNFNPAVIPSTMYLESTFGLSASGNAIVNGQGFTYTAKTDTTLSVATWLGLTTVVGAGNRVDQYDLVEAKAKRGYRIRDIKLWRKPKLSHILRGELHASIYTGDVLLPDAMIEDPEHEGEMIPDSWWLDWPGPGDAKKGIQLRPALNSVDTGLVSADLGFNPAHPEKNRYTKFMVLCEAMRGNSHLYPATSPKYVESGGLFVLNEIEIFLDELTVGGSTAGTENNLDAVIRDIFVNNLHFPASRLEINEWVRWTAFASQATTRSSYLSIMSEMLAAYGVCAVETLQGTMKFGPDPWWPWSNEANVWDAVYDIDESNIASINQQYGAVNTVAQARVVCRDAEGRSTYIGVYPAAPLSSGEYIDGGGGIMIAKNQRQADYIAESVYKKARNKNVASFVAVGPMPWLVPFMVLELNWTGSREDPDYYLRGESLWIVRSVSHQINLGSPMTALKATEKDWITTFECQTYSYTTSPYSTTAPLLSATEP